MKPRVIYNFKWLPKAYGAVTLYPYICFVDSKDEVPITMVVHEATHWLQVHRHGWLYFYSNYLYQYFKGLIKYRSHWDSYFNISWEVEAYKNEELFENGALSLDVEMFR